MSRVTNVCVNPRAGESHVVGWRQWGLLSRAILRDLRQLLYRMTQWVGDLIDIASFLGATGNFAQLGGQLDIMGEHLEQVPTTKSQTYSVTLK